MFANIQIKAPDVGRLVQFRCGRKGRIAKVEDGMVSIWDESNCTMTACRQDSGKFWDSKQDHPDDIMSVLPRHKCTVDWSSIVRFNFIARDGFSIWRVYETMPYLSGMYWKSSRGMVVVLEPGLIRSDIVHIPFRDSLFSRADWFYEVDWSAIIEAYGDWQYLRKDASGSWYLYGFRPKRKPGDAPLEYDRDSRARIDPTPFAVCFNPSAVDHRVSLIRQGRLEIERESHV